jgi:ADP-ribosylglycohydrolase
MRVGPVGFAFDTAEAVLAEAKRSAEVTHNHPEGIKGAQATALAVFMARQGETKAWFLQTRNRKSGSLSPGIGGRSGSVLWSPTAKKNAHDEDPPNRSTLSGKFFRLV